MYKIACRVEYKGQAYSGWQSQINAKSVQEEVEKALSQVANEPISIICAGRTDAGVHATGQIIHFETNSKRSNFSWMMGANVNLPADISISWVSEASEDFHARFSATSRSYRYIVNNSGRRSAMLDQMVTTHYPKLDEKLMQEAANYLIGKHDFSSYRAQRCQANTPIRDMQSIAVTRKQDIIYVDIKANAFLYHMVRNIMGVLMTIGAGEKPPLWAKIVLDYKDRSKGGVTAPPDGLYLVDVQYPSEFKMPEKAVIPSFN